jgi:hypothetical protein
MTSDHLTPAQNVVSGFTPGYFDDVGWDFGMSVRTRRAPRSLATLVPSAGLGRQLRMARHLRHRLVHDPDEDMTTILMIEPAFAPPRLPILVDFWTAAYQAIDD